MEPIIKSKIDVLIQRAKNNPSDFTGKIPVHSKPDSLNQVIRNKKEAEDFMRAMDALSGKHQ